MIFLFMYGGPSHVDTFDYKPKLYELDGQTIPVKTKGRGGSKERRTRRRAEMEVPAVRRLGPVGFRAVSAPGHLRRRPGVHQVDDRRLADSWLGDVANELGQDPQRQPLARLVGQLWPGQREREPARLRRDARSDRRPDQRLEELVERLHAGQLSRHAAAVARHADSRSEPAAPA